MGLEKVEALQNLVVLDLTRVVARSHMQALYWETSVLK